MSKTTTAEPTRAGIDRRRMPAPPGTGTGLSQPGTSFA
jgi:hypothetical protein